MKILTCNIRCPWAEDGEDDWELRKDFCAEVIRKQNPDIICFQEMWEVQHSFLSRALPEFSHWGMSDQPDEFRPMNTIFYRSSAFTHVTSGGYWLSETPHIPGSKSWDSACVRLANWIRLKDTGSEKEFRIVNTHLDHKGQTARENQARLITEDAKAYRDEYPQILTGDMNCDFTNKAINIFKSENWTDTYGQIHGTENPGRTFHEFIGQKCTHPMDKMDWIFVKGNFKVNDAEIIKDSKDGRFPSDHYFVSANINT